MSSRVAFLDDNLILFFFSRHFLYGLRVKFARSGGERNSSSIPIRASSAIIT